MHFHILLLSGCYFNRKTEILVLTSLISAVAGGQVSVCCFLFLEEDRHKAVLSVRKEATLKDSNIFLKKFKFCYVGSNIIPLSLFSSFSFNRNHLLLFLFGSAMLFYLIIISSFQKAALLSPLQDMGCFVCLLPP